MCLWTHVHTGMQLRVPIVRLNYTPMLRSYWNWREEKEVKCRYECNNPIGFQSCGHRSDIVIEFARLQWRHVTRSNKKSKVENLKIECKLY